MSHKKESRLDGLLHSAARNGDLAKVGQILDTGRVYIDCKDQDGITPLMLACSYGHESVAKKLLEEGADPNIRQVSGISSVFIACRGGYTSILQLLLQYGADVNSQTQEGGTPLMVCAQSGNIDLVSCILSSERLEESKVIRDENVKTNGTLSSSAKQIFMNNSEKGDLNVCQSPIKNLNSNSLHCTVNSTSAHSTLNSSPVHSTFNSTAVNSTTVARGVDVNASMWDGATALFLAAQNGNLEVVNQLLRVGGCDVDRQRRDGASPLWIACQTGHQEIVASLLQAGAQVDLVRNDGASPLHKACEKGHRRTVKEILKFNPNLGVLQNGETCLHAGARSGDPEVVTCLLEAGADPNLTSLAGIRPVDTAIGDTRSLLARVTTRSSVTCTVSRTGSRTSTPDRLSSIRSGASMYFRNSNPLLNCSYSGSLNQVAASNSGIAAAAAATSSSCNTSPASSPRRRASMRRSQYCLRAVNGRPISMDNCVSNNTGTPKHSVQFTDPVLNKHGLSVTKVQCKLMDSSELLPRELSPVPAALYLADLRRSTSSSPARAFPNTAV